MWSPIADWETYVALTRSYGMAATDARKRIALFVEANHVHSVGIGVEEAELAKETFETYGKGNHPAKLNMGDCFAYACAKTNHARLLYKGDDFSKTDLA